MISRRLKKTYYSILYPFMMLNGLLYKYLRSPGKDEFVKVQLGPGMKNYLPGWINIDANKVTAKCDIWADLRNPLPFHDSTVDAFYSFHVIEHLPDLRSHFQDVYRCLKPGGFYRFGGPNGDVAIDRFVANDLEWFSIWPERRNSIGGRFENFIFCKQEHLTILTFSYLNELCLDAGFVDVGLCPPVLKTNYPEIFAECLKIEHERDFNHPHSIVIEARKPKKN
jgi:SAM-dependent methyltransferase